MLAWFVVLGSFDGVAKGLFFLHTNLLGAAQLNTAGRTACVKYNLSSISPDKVTDQALSLHIFIQ